MRLLTACFFKPLIFGDTLHSKLYRRLEHLDHQEGREALAKGLYGLEKESLRVIPDGHISQTTHPLKLGSALTHPRITTDYSEALLELITPPSASIDACLKDLDKTSRFVYESIDEELMWAASMPCLLSGEDSIPVAVYGDSNVGRLKNIYRRGLAVRYGKTMQVISGVHFNYSLSMDFWRILHESEHSKLELQDYISSNYVALARNFWRYAWLIPYLFGSSPAVCKSFFSQQPTELETWGKGTLVAPYGTSLRISDYGYQNRKACDPEKLISYDSLDDYVQSLRRLTAMPYPDYAALGFKKEGQYQQLNTNWLQIENEYYSPVRLKQVCDRDEKPSHALEKRGVQYLEIRALDVNLFEPLGVTENQLRFLELLLLYCLLQDSPLMGLDESCALDRNLKAVAVRGRDPELALERGDQKIKLTDWADEICSHLTPIAEILDADSENHLYSRALEAQRVKIQAPELTPSARVLAELRNNNEEFFYFAMRKSQEHKKTLLAQPLDAASKAAYQQAASLSQKAQSEIEASDKQNFDDFLAEYMAS